jgi:hypothetical protein
MLSGPASPAARTAARLTAARARAARLLFALPPAAAAVTQARAQPAARGPAERDAAPPAARAAGAPRRSFPQRLGRQVSASVDAGAAAVTYDEFLNSGVASVTPTLRVESARALVVARGSYSRFQSGNRSLQTSLTGSLVSPELFGVRAEAFGTASVTRFARELAATNLFGAGRLHAASGAGGAWAGAGLGLVSQRTRLPENVGQLDFGAWAREGPLTFTLTVQPTRVGAVSYADATAGARWQGALGELAVSSGYRARAAAALPGVRAWGEGWLTVWFGARVAVVGGVGLFPYDPVQGLPGGRYVSAAVRVSSRRPVVNDPALRAELLLPYEVRRLRAARAEQFVVEERDDGSRELRVLVPGAGRVELMGDFTDWTPVGLVRLPRGKGAGRDADDAWGVELVIAPGVHRVNIRVDGGAWRPPPGLSVVRDEFGGEVGLLVVR